MRTEKEMFELILGIAKKDERVRAVIMNGSRANPNIPKDRYQDYDIVYVVKELETFLKDHSWVNIFGERLMLQMPEAMRYPSGEGHFNYQMLFTDTNRIDLTLIPLDKLELIGNDSLSVTLLDKDNIIPVFQPSNDSDYHIKPPSELFFFSCCNNFWWCLQNVAKGVTRDELPYAMLMLHNVVREELHDMISWYIGAQTNYKVSAGKMGKYFKKYLPDNLYKMYTETYSNSDYNNVWGSIFSACELFHLTAVKVAGFLNVSYNQDEENGMMDYLKEIKSE